MKKRIIVMCTLVPAVYVLSYYIVVNLRGYTLEGPLPQSPVQLSLGVRVSNPVLHWLYQPMYNLDYRLRPSYWQFVYETHEVEYTDSSP